MTILHINKQSTFKLLVELTNYHGDNFKLTFYTNNFIKKTVVCSFVDGEYTNCSMVDSTHLLCTIPAGGLRLGLLKCEEAHEFREGSGTYEIVNDRLIVGTYVSGSGKLEHISYIEITDSIQDSVGTTQVVFTLLGTVLKGRDGALTDAQVEESKQRIINQLGDSILTKEQAAALYQRKLTPGKNIEIDSDNVIMAYGRSTGSSGTPGGSGSSGGSSDYEELYNLPSINGVTLIGDRTGLSYGLYTKPSSGIPQTDLEEPVQILLQRVHDSGTVLDHLRMVESVMHVIDADFEVEHNMIVDGITTHKDKVASSNFVTGAPTSGSGWQIDHDGNIEGESIKLRGFMEVPEIRFNRASVIVGTNIQSECGGIIESVTPLSDTTGIVTLHLEDDDIAGSVQEGDLCWGYWHDINTKTNNAGEDYDSHTGIINYQGFATVYFSISEILNKNSTRFRYELRPETNTDGKPKYPLHPYEGMHFGGRGNQKLNGDGKPKYPSRQGFTISTSRYTAVYQMVGSWDWSEMAKYVVQVQGYLDGFEVVANMPVGTWHNEFGTIAGNIYYKGKIIEVNSAARYMYITQSSNGVLQADEDPEVVSIVIRNAMFEDKTADFDIYVNDTKVYSKGSTTACVLTYNYSDLQDAINRYSVVAKGTREIRKYENGTYKYETEEYTVDGSFLIRKEVPVTAEMEIICSDTLISLNENKEFGFRIMTNTGYDITKEVHTWKIERKSSDEASDAVWNVGAKAMAFAEQHYVKEAKVYILWSNDENNDLDPDPSQNVTYFTVTALMGDDEEAFQAVITY